MADFAPIFKFTQIAEGGYSAPADDEAGWCDGKNIGTNRGISAIAYKGYYGVCPTVGQMQSLTVGQSEIIYKSLFWQKLRGDEIKNQNVAHILFDAFIASGYKGLQRDKKYINAVYGKEVMPVNNSSLTQADVALINNAPQQRLFDIAKAGEIQARKDVAAANPEKEQFLKGWLLRLDKINFTPLQAAVSYAKRNWIPIITLAGIAGLTTYALIRVKK